MQEEDESDNDSPCLIILPENRIQVMDDEINPRVRAQLLGEDQKAAIVKVPREVQETAFGYFKAFYATL